MEYIVSNIQYDTSNRIAKTLPKSIVINVPDDLCTYEEIEEYLSDEISNQTGWCHKGFSVTPEIPK